MLAVSTIIKIWAQSVTLVGDNAELLTQTRHDPLISELCSARMEVLSVAEALLATLNGQQNLPEPLVAFFAADADKGCNHCWLSSRMPKEHPECWEKINRWFDTRTALQIYGSSL